MPTGAGASSPQQETQSVRIWATRNGPGQRRSGQESPRSAEFFFSRGEGRRFASLSLPAIRVTSDCESEETLMPSLPGHANLIPLIAVCTVLALLPACSGRGRGDTAAATASSGPKMLPPDPRFPADTRPRENGRSAEWVFWLLPKGENEAAGCYARGGTEFIAKSSAHTLCATNYPGRSFYSVGGCTDPQRMAYATSLDGNFTWRVCVDGRVGWEKAQAEAVKVCESSSGQKCVGQWPLSDAGGRR